jgi:hypothetical protein
MEQTISTPQLRVMQWNILADGLAQYGDFIQVPTGLEMDARHLVSLFLELFFPVLCLPVGRIEERLYSWGTKLL